LSEQRARVQNNSFYILAPKIKISHQRKSTQILVHVQSHTGLEGKAKGKISQTIYTNMVN